MSYKQHYCFKFLSVVGNYYGFWPKGVKILIFPLFRLKFDDITVTLPLIVFES